MHNFVDTTFFTLQHFFQTNVPFSFFTGKGHYILPEKIVNDPTPEMYGALGMCAKTTKPWWREELH